MVAVKAARHEKARYAAAKRGKTVAHNVGLQQQVVVPGSLTACSNSMPMAMASCPVKNWARWPNDSELKVVAAVSAVV